LLPGTAAEVGPNGQVKAPCGNSDLIPRCKDEIEGRPIERLGRLRQQLGYMPQNFIFDPAFHLVNWWAGMG